MKGELYGSLERLDANGIAALQHDWQALEACCDQSFFISWGWIGPWVALTLPHVELFAFRAQREGRIVAMGIVSRYRCKRGKILPGRVLALNEARTNGLDMVIEHNDLLGLPAELEECRDVFLQTLLDAPFTWAELQLGAVSPDWHVALESTEGALYEQSREQRVPWIADILGTSTIDEVLTRLSSNRRSKIRQSIRQFEGAYGPLRIEEPGSTERALEAFDRMGELHTARWNRAGLAGSWANPNWVQFHRSLNSSCFAQGKVQLVSLFAGDTLLGTIYNFLHGKRVYMLQSGFAEPRKNTERPGYVAHCMAMALNGARGYSTYDFMCGDAEYKRSLGLADTPMAWTRYRRPTVLNMIEDILIGLYRRASRCRASKAGDLPEDGG